MTPFSPKPGIAYLWALNDRCDPEVIDAHIDAFAKADVAAVCLHPRSGLELPYGGDDWFAMIRRTAKRCAERGVRVWLYDEDPYPSGAAGGRITAEFPELAARRIRCYEADPALPAGENFCFGTGKLLWCGLASEDGADAVDLTARVGMIRRKWEVLDPWDSRNYYPDTPLYACQRAWTKQEEFAVRVPHVPAGMKLVAFVAAQIQGNHWRLMPDSLNPQVTKLFLQLTHERYRQAVGDMFGREIEAIFLDEPKFYDSRPWTPGLFEEIERRYGYDIRPRLLHLFRHSDADIPSLTRLHYRQLCAERFRHAWLRPVAEWCRLNRLALVGHISPEDDPVHQSNCVGNLFPLQQELTIPGIDLIVPAVGDRRHPVLNVGIVSAVSVAQQYERPGVMSESLACSGLDFTADQARRVLLWQTVMGLTCPVVHAAYNSVEGHRKIDAPPDYGPLSPIWPGMGDIARELAPLQQLIRDARQVAPVAILWPIRTYQMGRYDWRNETTGRRAALNQLLSACLDHQVGTHFIDEATLWEATPRHGRATIGRAAYSHLLIPASTVLHEKTVAMLRSLHEAGVQITIAGEAPARQQTETSLEPLDLSPITTLPIDQAVANLPRLVQLEGADPTDIRCTIWERAGVKTTLLLNISSTAKTATLAGRPIDLPPDQVVQLQSPVPPAPATKPGRMIPRINHGR